MLETRFQVRPGRTIHLRDHDPGYTGKLRSRAEAQEMLEERIARMGELQQKLYAQDRWSLLLVFQAMDAAGKDSTIKHVMSGLNPQGCQVFSFKAPSTEELDHDYLWRVARCLPERGRIGIFNRSHYEEVLIVRVHPGILKSQKLPPALVSEGIWSERFEDINGFERHLARNGTVIRKFFLNVSWNEQRDRFLARLDEPHKYWKFSLDDVKEREHWSAYMRAYEEMLAATSTEHAPWYVVPADHKWFARLVVAGIVVETLESLKLSFPAPTPEKKRELDQARLMLESDANHKHD